MKTIAKIYLYAQLVFAVFLMLFAVFNAIRSMVQGTGIIYVVLFGAMAFVAYNFFFAPSIAELRERRAK